MPRFFNVSLERARTNFDAAVTVLIKKIAPTVKYSGISFGSPPGTVNAYENLVYQVSAYFLGMPQRPNSRKNTENVFLIGLLNGIVVNKEAQLKSYATEVSYCRMVDPSNQNGDLTPVAGYHFDFECASTKINHPIFHAQQKLTAGSRFFSVNKDFSPPKWPDEHREEIRTLRIPTPQMDIFSAIVMILADHIVSPDGTSKEFVDFLNEINKNILPVNFDAAQQVVPRKFLDAHPIYIQNWYPVNQI